MHLMYYLGSDGKRVYTLKKVAPDGAPTKSAHPGASPPPPPRPPPAAGLARPARGGSPPAARRALTGLA